MFLAFILSGFLIAAFLMAVAKRLSALVRAFQLQSLFLFFYTCAMAFTQRHLELFVVCGLIFALKVLIIPRLVTRIAGRINAEEGLGLVVNPQISLMLALSLSYLSSVFAYKIMPLAKTSELAAFSVSVAALCIGFLIMVSRMKALAQALGLLAMENGIFLAAGAIAGGMPFFVEIAFFFDIFVFVIIIEIFVYRVNRLFTHIDISKMKALKG